MKVRFTAKVRRGLVLVHQLMLDAFNDDKPPVGTIVGRWKKSQRSDFDAAMAWMESQNPSAEARDVQISTVERTPLADILLAHRFLYYVRGTPVITDQEYDKLEKEAVIGLAEDHPLQKPGSDLVSSYSDETKALADRLANGEKV